MSGLRITSVNSQNLRALDGDAQPIRDETDGCLDAKIEVLRAFCAANDHVVLTPDLRDAILKQGPGSVDLEVMSLALSELEFQVNATYVAALSLTKFPVLAQMSEDQFVIILGQDGGEVELYDTSSPNNRAKVALDQFEAFFTGHLLQITKKSDVQKTEKKVIVEPKEAHWFWSAFTPYRRQFGEIVLGSFVSNLLAVAIALFALQVYDRVIPHQSEATLWVLAFGAFIALIMEAALKIARSRFIDQSGRQIEKATQTVLMDRLLGMRLDLMQRSPSQLFSAMREFGSIREFFTASAVGTLADIPFILIFLILVYSIGGPVVGVLIVGGVLMVLPSLLLRNHVMQSTQQMQNVSAQSNRVLHEILGDLETVKTQRAEDRFRKTWAKLGDEAADRASSQRGLASVLTFWSQAVQQATYIAAVVACTYLVFAGDLTVGAIIAVSILTSRTLAPLTQLSSTLSRWSNVKAALDSLGNIIEAPQDVTVDKQYLRRDAVVGALELREVQFRHGPDEPLVLDIPAALIKANETVAVLGSNGAGKSTLLRMLSGLYAPTRGSLILDGADMAQIAPKDLRRVIGYLGQEVRLFNGTLRDNLNLSLLHSDDDRLYQALDFAGLGQYVKEHAHGLDLPIYDGGHGLSIGQRQSIGWARLWLQDPKICLLDEPTASLDQTLESTLISRLEDWLQGRTAVIATHRVPILSLAQRTMIIQNGRLAVDGPRDAVLAHLKTHRAGGEA